jgi:hypothetical protein
MQSTITVCGTDIRINGQVLRTARLEADRFHFIDTPEQIVDGLLHCGTRVDLFTFLARLPNISPKFSFPMEWDNLAVLPVITYDHWWARQIGFKARNKCKQAEKKGVAVREVPFDPTLVRGIWGVYNECPVRQGVRFRHYGKSLETVHREEATFLDSSIFIGAFLDNELIGFIKLVYDDKRMQAGMMNVVSMIRHRDKAPTNALIAQAVKSCSERGIKNLVYGSFAYGKKERSSLSDFKERNGFQRVDIPRYYVPVTVLGQVAVALGLHHRLAERVPEVIAIKLRKLRAAWYKSQYPAASDAL